MEKEKLFMNTSSPPTPHFAGLSSMSPNWQSSLGVEVQLGEMNYGSEKFLNLKWENSMDQSVPFESVLGSIVSSPAALNSVVPANSVVIRELFGRLGSISNNGEITSSKKTLAGTHNASYIGGNGNRANTSCYRTPFNSPSELNLSMVDHQIRRNQTVIRNSMASGLAPFSADPRFVERAANFSCFGSQNFGVVTGQFAFPEAELQYISLPGMESGKLLGVSSSQSMKAGSQMGVLENKDMTMQDGLEAEMRSASASDSAPVSDRKFSRLSISSTLDDAEFINSQEEMSATEPSSKGRHEANARKRKAVQRGKANELHSAPSAKDAKAAEDHDSNAKKCKPTEETETGKDVVKAKFKQKGSPNSGSDCKNQAKDSSKPPEAPKQDYIHVRARRGQATDSHSLAERVRREKISERMKVLQDLVPGCNKVTGKTVMLDEIINYVQSLQRQVEFLSMKLATVNPRQAFNMEALLSKDIQQTHGSLTQMLYPLNSSASGFSYGHQFQQGPLQTVISNGLETVIPLDATLHRTLGTKLPATEGYGNASSQLATFGKSDLQSIAHMDFGQNKEMAFPLERFQGSLPTDHMKVEL